MNATGLNVGSISILVNATTRGFNTAQRQVRMLERTTVSSASKMSAAIHTTELAIASFGARVTMVGAAMTKAFTIPLALLGGVGLKRFMDFEYELSKITGLVGIAESQTAKWADQLQRLAIDSGQGLQELAEGMYYVTSAGMRGKQAMEVLDYSARAAAVGLGETKTVADIVTSSMNAYGKDTLSAAAATDILITAIKVGKAYPPEFATALGKVLPVSSQLGVSFKEVGAAVAAMTRTGTPAATAGMQLRQTLFALVKTTPMANREMQALGSSFHEIQGMLKEEGGLMKGLMRLKYLTGKGGGIESMAKIFPNIRALVGVLDIMGENLIENADLWYEMLYGTNDALKAAEEAYKKTLKYRWNTGMEEFLASVTALGKALKNPFLNLLDAVVAKISQLTNWFKSLNEKQQVLAMRFTLIAAAAGPVLMIVGGLITALSKIFWVLGGLVKVLFSLGKALVAVGKGFLALATNPVTITIAAIVAIVYVLNTAIWALADSWKSVTNHLSIGWNSILLGALNVVKWFMNFDWSKMWANFIATMSAFFSSIWEGFLGFLDSLESKLERWIDKVQNSNLVKNFGNYGASSNEEGAPKVEMLEEPDPIKKGGWLDGTIAKIEKANAEFRKRLEGQEGFGDAFVKRHNQQVDTIKDLIGKVDLGFNFKDLIPEWVTDMPIFNVGGLGSFSSGIEEETELMIAATKRQLKVMEWFQLMKLDVAKNQDIIAMSTTTPPIGFEKAFNTMNMELANARELSIALGSSFDLLTAQAESYQTVVDGVESGKFIVTPENIDQVLQVYEALKLVNSQLDKTAEKGINVTKRIQSLLISGFVSMGETIGEMLAGDVTGIEGFLKGILSIVLDFAKQFGKILITIGLARDALSTIAISGVGAIVAGIALVAAASAGQALLNKGPDLAQGGIIPAGYEGDKFSANLNSNEAVIPLDTLWTQMRGMFGDGVGNGGKVSFHIDGYELAGVLEKQSKIHNAF